MKQSQSWEPNLFSATQEIPPHFMEPEGSLPHSQVSANCPYPEPWCMGPCHHGMARLQVADGGTASFMEDSYEYIE